MQFKLNLDTWSYILASTCQSLLHSSENSYASLGSETPGTFTEYLWTVQLSTKINLMEGKGLLIDTWVLFRGNFGQWGMPMLLPTRILRNF